MSVTCNPESFADDDFAEFISAETEAMRSMGREPIVKVEEDESWLIRFLPTNWVDLPVFWGCYAQHWVNKRPYFCAQQTKVEFGGIEGYECPICAYTKELNDHRDRVISSLGYRSAANFQWLFYCLVWSKKKGKDGEEIPTDDPWRPHRFWLNRTNYDEISAIFINYRKKYPKASRLSIMDPEHGLDFTVRGKPRGLIGIQREESRSIYPEDVPLEEREAFLQDILNHVKPPVLNPPSEEEVQAVCQKIEESVEFALRQPVAPPARAVYRAPQVRHVVETRRTPPAAPAPRPTAPTPPPRPASVQRPVGPVRRQPLPPDADEIPFEPAQSEQAEQTEDETPPTPPPQPRPSTVARARVQPLVSAVPRAPSMPKVPPVARTAPTPPARSPARPPSAAVPRPLPRAPQAQLGAAPIPSSVDDTDNVTDEVGDLAPPADSSQAEPEETDAPPNPVANAQNPRPRLSDKLRRAMDGKK